MQRTLRGARTDCTPGQKLGVILRRDEVKDFRCRRDAESCTFEQQSPRVEQALTDVAATIEVGIVDKALPAETGPGLLEIYPHDDLHLLRKLLAQLEKFRAEFQCAFGIMD